jgi:hypothetical protein
LIAKETIATITREEVIMARPKKGDGERMEEHLRVPVTAEQKAQILGAVPKEMGFAAWARDVMLREAGVASGPVEAVVVSEMRRDGGWCSRCRRIGAPVVPCPVCGASQSTVR